MTLKFWKYQGTGNDFVMLDGRAEAFKALTQPVIQALCHRRFGIGADGLIILRPHDTADFYMEYYNADGRTSSMCGNGGRCIVRFASDLGLERDHYQFEAVDGGHEAYLEGEQVALKMRDAGVPEKVGPRDFVVHTGSPHYVRFAERAEEWEDFLSTARDIRHASPYAAEGINVNLVEVSNAGLYMRTFERGVEDETYSCGTGVTAAALAVHYSGRWRENQVKVRTPGGNLSVQFEPAERGYRDIWLRGEARKVFEGNWLL